MKQSDFGPSIWLVIDTLDSSGFTRRAANQDIAPIERLSRFLSSQLQELSQRVVFKRSDGVVCEKFLALSVGDAESAPEVVRHDVLSPGIPVDPKPGSSGVIIALTVLRGTPNITAEAGTRSRS